MLLGMLLTLPNMQQYTVLHKHFMGKQERTLTIDGEYIHVLAAENRTLFESAKTVCPCYYMNTDICSRERILQNSHHVSAVISCRLTKKQSPHFKLIVKKVDRDNKSYDLEALSPNEAGECMRNCVNSLSLSFCRALNHATIAEICARISFMAKRVRKGLGAAMSASSLNLMKQCGLCMKLHHQIKHSCFYCVSQRV